MTQLIRTTVTIPKNLLKAAKITAVAEDKNLSQLMREALEERVRVKRKIKKDKHPLTSLAELGITGGPKDLSARLDYYLYGRGSKK